MLAFVRSVFERISWDGLRNRCDGFVLGGARQLLIILELGEEAEIPVTVVRREQFAFFANQNTAAAGDLVEQAYNIGGDFLWRLVAAIEPPKRNRRLLAARGKFKPDF